VNPNRRDFLTQTGQMALGGFALSLEDAVPGRIYKLTLDGKVLGVLGDAGKEPNQFGWIHEIACPSENELYVAELLNLRVQRLTLTPRPSQHAARSRD
jgi:hypothetical protein